MKKEPLWKRELKELLIISSVFFVIFLLLLFLKKVLLDDYKVDFYIVSTALIGSLIIAKVVLIFDLLPVTKKTDRLANIYRVLLRSLIYGVGYLIFTFIEHLIKGLIDGKTLSSAFETTLQQLSSNAFIVSFVGVMIAFVLFNSFWVVRATIGPAALYDMFFKKNA
jgi:hypothetical protein